MKFFHHIFIFAVACSLICEAVPLADLAAAEPDKTGQAGEQYGLQFDGKDSYVTLPHLKFDDWGAFTVEAWVKDWNGRICCQGKQGDPENSLWISIRANGHSTGWESENGTNYAVAADPNSIEGWDHVALVFDGKEQSIFLNGKQIHRAAAPKPGPFDPNRQFFIGAQEKWKETQTKPAALNGKGVMRLLCISKVARYDKEFTPEKTPGTDDDTIVLFNVATPDKSQLLDASKNKLHGTLHSVKWVTVQDD
ncbi:MAG: LamG domain-containing protein [Planctomycetota bacterium]